VEIQEQNRTEQIVVSVNYVALFKTSATFCFSREHALLLSREKGTYGYHYDIDENDSLGVSKNH
jgi:hypothetical protein